MAFVTLVVLCKFHRLFFLFRPAVSIVLSMLPTTKNRSYLLRPHLTVYLMKPVKPTEPFFPLDFPLIQVVRLRILQRQQLQYLVLPKFFFPPFKNRGRFLPNCCGFFFPPRKLCFRVFFYSRTRPEPTKPPFWNPPSQPSSLVFNSLEKRMSQSPSFLVHRCKPPLFGFEHSQTLCLFFPPLRTRGPLFPFFPL